MTKTAIRSHDAQLLPASVITIEQDPIDCIIRVTGEGFLAVKDFESMFFDVGRLVSACHIRSSPARVLVDNRSFSVNGPEPAERLRELARRLYRDGDRVAIIVVSTIARIQFKRLLDFNTHQLFLEEHDAVDWLRSPD